MKEFKDELRELKNHLINVWEEKQGRQVKHNAEKEDRKWFLSEYPKNLAHLAVDVSKQLHDRRA